MSNQEQALFAILKQFTLLKASNIVTSLGYWQCYMLHTFNIFQDIFFYDKQCKLTKIGPARCPERLFEKLDLLLLQCPVGMKGATDGKILGKCHVGKIEYIDCINRITGVFRKEWKVEQHHKMEKWNIRDIIFGEKRKRLLKFSVCPMNCIDYCLCMTFYRSHILVDPQCKLFMSSYELDLYTNLMTE